MLVVQIQKRVIYGVVSMGDDEEFGWDEKNSRFDETHLADTDYSAESGFKAEAEPIVQEILDYHREDSAENMKPDPDEHGLAKMLNWDDEHDRQHVREKFENPGEHEGLLPAFGPDGHGEDAYDDCGDSHPFVCNSCGHSVEFGRTCARSVCARCGRAWIRDTGINKSAHNRRVRIEKHKMTPDDEHQKFHHIVISPSLDWYQCLASLGMSLDEANQTTKEVVKSILDEMNAPGMLARHDYRGKHPDGSIRSESDDRGFWKTVVGSDREFYGDVRDALAWRPHYHAVVVADWVKTGDFTTYIEDMTGWVIHRISRSDGKSIKSDGHMARAQTYTISHLSLDDSDDRVESEIDAVGTVCGDGIANTARFSKRPSDIGWADAKVRDACLDLLGFSSADAECGVELPPVDDPDELARRVLKDLYPDEDPEVPEDVVLEHVRQGNISVEVSSTGGSGGDVTVKDAFGMAVGPDGIRGSASDMPSVPSTAVTYDGGEEAVAPLVDVLDDDSGRVVDDQDQPADAGDVDRDDEDDQDGEDNQHDDHDHDDCECNGSLIPLGEFREEGYLDRDEWVQDAPHVDEAREVDREEPDDLTRWRASSPGDAVGGG